MPLYFIFNVLLRNSGEQLLSLSEFDELRATKQPNASAMASAGSTSAVELDQILDLNHAPETSGAAAEVVAVNEGPIIAFEDSITSPKPEPPVAGKTTKESFL